MSHLWRMFRTGLTLLRKPLAVSTKPLHFQLEPATGCNLACQTCQVPRSEERCNVTLEQFKRIFDEIQPIKVALSGAGEPFLNPDLIDIIRYAKECGASVLTTTNFTLATRKLEAIVESGLDLIKISLDAASPETYHHIRGRDFYNRIIEDTRIPALETDTSKYVFASPKGFHEGAITVEVRLVFRRAFYDLMQQKGWNTPDITMEKLIVQVP